MKFRGAITDLLSFPVHKSKHTQMLSLAAHTHYSIMHATFLSKQPAVVSPL